MTNPTGSDDCAPDIDDDALDAEVLAHEMRTERDFYFYNTPARGEKWCPADFVYG